MRIVLQRVSEAAVQVGAESVSKIGPGLLLLVAVEKCDSSEQAKKAAKKLSELRVFGDESGRMQLDCRQVSGEILLVSQFTLAGSLDRGRRPSFDRAASPELATRLVDELACALRAQGLPVKTGRFGAQMCVTLTNEGPVTFVLDFN